MNPNHMRNVVYKEIFDDNLVVANSIQEGCIPSANDMQVQDNIENDDTYIQPTIGENGDLVEEIISNMDMLWIYLLHVPTNWMYNDHQI